ncbi:UDP-N-acetylglucosamine 2-epimerase [Staphylococcus aureus]
MRSVTERPEGVEAGTLKVIGTNKQNVYQAAKELIDDERLYHQTSEHLILTVMDLLQKE